LCLCVLNQDTVRCTSAGGITGVDDLDNGRGDS